MFSLTYLLTYLHKVWKKCMQAVKLCTNKKSSSSYLEVPVTRRLTCMMAVDVVYLVIYLLSRHCCIFFVFDNIQDMPSVR